MRLRLLNGSGEMFCWKVWRGPHEFGWRHRGPLQVMKLANQEQKPFSDFNTNSLLRVLTNNNISSRSQLSKAALPSRSALRYHLRPNGPGFHLELSKASSFLTVNIGRKRETLSSRPLNLRGEVMLRLTKHTRVKISMDRYGQPGASFSYL
jgi:hypothetical protein